MRLVGIDCASQDKNCGLALAEVYGGHMSVLDLQVGEGNVVPILAEWISDRQPAILALDAPLGWPRPLSAALPKHIGTGAVCTCYVDAAWTHFPKTRSIASSTAGPATCEYICAPGRRVRGSPE